HYLLLSFVLSFLFFLLIQPPPRSTLFPYTTLFRSSLDMLLNFAKVQRNEDVLVGRVGHPLARCFDPKSAVELHRTVSGARLRQQDRKSTRLNSSHDQISYAVFCLKKKKK